MGHANLLYSRGEYNEAMDKLKALVKDVPNAHEPWLTLGTIYEEIGEMSKSIGCFFMAAHLTPKDATMWKRVAQSSMYDCAIIDG